MIGIYKNYRQRVRRLNKLKSNYAKAVKEERDYFLRGEEFAVETIKLHKNLLWLSYNQHKYFWMRNL